MGALFVGSLTTYSHTYSGSTKTLAAYYERRYNRLICLNTGKDLDDKNRMRYTFQEYLKSEAESAARSAARSAAWSAASAVWSAEGAVSAERSAVSAVFRRYADVLIDLLKNA